MSSSDTHTQGKKTKSSVSRILTGAKFVLRFGAFIATFWLLLCAENELLSRLANWATFVSLAGGFYLAVVEPQILAWIIHRVSRILVQARSGIKIKLPFPFAFPTLRFAKGNEAPVHSDKTEELTPETENREEFVRKKETKTDQPASPMWQFCIALILMLLLAFFAKSPLPENGLPKVEVGPKKGPTEDLGKSREPSLPAVKPEDGQESAPTERFHTITNSDRCYTIALSCTGDGERFVELGPPTNMNLDVSNRDYCHLVPGQSLNIPQSWPEGCPE